MRSINVRVVSRSVDIYIAPMTASIASAKIEDLSCPPVLSSPLPNNKKEPKSSSRATSARAEALTTAARSLAKLPLGFVGEVPKQPFGNDNAQDGVAEEFQALVGG